MLKFFGLTNFLFILTSNGLGAAEAGMPQLNPEFWLAQIFWLIFIFGTLYVIIWKLILPKITASIENRKRHLVNDLDEAEKIKKNAEKKLNDYKAIIENAKKEAKKIVLEGKRKLEQDINNKRKKFNIEMDGELKEAEKEVKNFKLSSINNINKIAVAISNEIIRSTMGTEANESNVSAIVGEILRKKTEKGV